MNVQQVFYRILFFMKNLALTFALFFSFFAPAQDEITFTVYFETNEAIVGEHDLDRLTEICALLKDRSILDVSSLGFADARGDQTTNEKLGIRRAQALANAFQNVCNTGVGITIESLGETHAVMADTEPEDLLRVERKATLYIHAEASRSVLHASEELIDEQEVKIVFPDGSYAASAPRLEYIKPLIPEIDKMSQVFTVDPSERIELLCNDGALLTIPANTIVDTNGKLVQGPVNIHYRSFMDSYSIIASGIPMHMKTKDGMGHFQTAGMFEVLASKDGEMLNLKKGEQISISREKEKALDPDFGTYVLDPTSGSWQDGGSLTNTTVDSNNGFAQFYFNREFVNGMWKHAEPDSLNFDERRANAAYPYLRKTFPSNPKGVLWKNKRRSPYFRVAAVPNIELESSGKSVWKRNARVTFRINCSIGYFPELQAFPQDMVWELNEDISTATFKDRFLKKHWYQDIDVQLDPETFEGVLRLKESGRWIRMEVSIAQNVNRSNKRRYQRAIVSYADALERKRKRFNGKTAGTYARWVRKRERTIARSYRDATEFMSAEERSWPRQQFVDSAEANHRVLNRRYGSFAGLQSLETMQKFLLHPGNVRIERVSGSTISIGS